MSANDLRVAIVGAGPAGLYAAGHLLHQHDVTVNIDLIDRLPTPFGLVRAGVAPDHPEKKLVIDRLFDFYLDHPRVRFFGNVELGTDITHEDLDARYDAVIYAVGASDDVSLGIPGEDLPGSHSARDFVGWYNGHPDFRDLRFDLSGKRAVIIGNGNVALDVARILTLGPRNLSQTEIADHALAALTRSAIEEVIILGRRGPEHAAFNNPEIEEFADLEGIDVEVEGVDFDGLSEQPVWNVRRKLKTLKQLAEAPSGLQEKRIILRFMTAPVAISGGAKVAGLKTITKTASGEQANTIETGLVLRCVGYRGAAVLGLPFDDARCTIPNEHGRVIDPNAASSGVYVTGWIKRGPKGVIGTNKKCALETVHCLLEDAKAGRLERSAPEIEGLEALLKQRKSDWVATDDWRRIDMAERTNGADQERPRVKISSWNELLQMATS
ncbi:MAG: FAD-dependent oxidoreductase [Marinomonas sp.]